MDRGEAVNRCGSNSVKTATIEEFVLVESCWRESRGLRIVWLKISVLVG